MRQAKLAYLSVEEYLHFEQQGEIRHEYVDGQIYAMAGTTKQHNAISLNIAALLRAKVRGTPCRAYIADVKVRIEFSNAFYYPDVMVGCDPSDNHELYLAHPCLIIEVLSPSTENIDRREKLFAYRTLPSLREYVLIGAEEKKVEAFRRETGGEWSLTTLTMGDTLQLECIAAAISLDDIYEDIS
jgi:Uma2 family endonuclease